MVQASVLFATELERKSKETFMRRVKLNRMYSRRLFNRRSNALLTWRQRKLLKLNKWKIPIIWFEWKCERFVNHIRQWAFIDILEYAGRFSIIIVFIMYVIGHGDRVKEKHYQAWQVINTAQGKPGNAGRIDALQDLNEDGVSLAEVDLSGKAYLKGIKLQYADLWNANLKNADLSESILKGTILEMANMMECDLYNANLQNTYLRNTNFENTILDFTDLRGATTELYSTHIHENDIMYNYYWGELDWVEKDIKQNTITNRIKYEYSKYKHKKYKERFKKSGSVRYERASVRMIGNPTNFKSTRMEYTKLNYANLSNANLINVKCVSCNITNTILIFADIKNADFRTAIGITKNQILETADWRGAQFPDSLKYLELPEYASVKDIEILREKILHGNIKRH